MEDRLKLDLGKSQRDEVEELKKNKRISRGDQRRQRLRITTIAAFSLVEMSSPSIR
jgi:hypothetical protein